MKSASAHILPLLVLPLCGMARISPPVFCSYAARYFQSSSGSSVSKAEMGRTWFTRSGSSRKMTTRCRLSPPGEDVHSKPLKAVNFPGSLYFVATPVTYSHTERLILSLLYSSCRLPMLRKTSSATWLPSDPPFFILSYQPLPTSVASKSGSALLSKSARPRYSAWSDTTRKSSGLLSLARRPELDVTSSPRAKRYASSGPSLVPIRPSSNERRVWLCVSPQKTRLGKCWSGYGE